MKRSQFDKWRAKVVANYTKTETSPLVARLAVVEKNLSTAPAYETDRRRRDYWGTVFEEQLILHTLLHDRIKDDAAQGGVHDAFLKAPGPKGFALCSGTMVD